MTYPLPPDWLLTLASSFIRHAAPWLYWLLAVTHLLIWWVLRWQRRSPETMAARWFRVFLFSKMWLWLSLALGRTVFREWLPVGFALVTVYIAIASLGTLFALMVSYAVPAWRCRGGRCEPDAHPIDEMMAASQYRDGERRSGRERRTGWPGPPTSPG